jgi:hypothetical protein
MDKRSKSHKQRAKTFVKNLTKVFTHCTNNLIYHVLYSNNFISHTSTSYPTTALAIEAHTWVHNQHRSFSWRLIEHGLGIRIMISVWSIFLFHSAACAPCYTSIIACCLTMALNCMQLGGGGGPHRQLPNRAAQARHAHPDHQQRLSQICRCNSVGRWMLVTWVLLRYTYTFIYIYIYIYIYI